MSGPKVIRIVTREEILEICHGQMARVDAALAEWTRIGKRNDCIDVAAVGAAQRRRDELAALISAEKLMDLQKQAPVEEAFLRRDMQERLAKVAAEQVAARSRERRGREAGASLLRSLRRAGKDVNADLERGLLAGDAASLSKGLRAMAELAPTTPKASSELAAGLREEGGTQSIATWLEKQPAMPSDRAILRIEKRLAELAQTVVEEEVAQMRTRLSEAESAPKARRSLVLDGLEVESGRKLDEARRREALIADLKLTIAECQAAGLHVDGEANGYEGVDADAIEVRLEEACGALDAHRAAAAAATRRVAILGSLSALGYELEEGMSASTPEDGRLVMRSTTRPDYGVEMTAGGASGRMQMKPVAFNAGGRGPDPARDRDAETIWCGDVSKLQEHLAKLGDGLIIEKSLPVGAVALKRVEIAASPMGADLAAPVRKERSRPT